MMVVAMFTIDSKVQTNNYKELGASRSKYFPRTSFDMWHSCFGLLY